MVRKAFLSTLVTSAAAAAILAAPASAQQDRVSATEKGSLLLYPKVELRWNHAGDLIQDTFITINNDFPADVLVQGYFVNGDEPLHATFIPHERAHPGWNWQDVRFRLTANQPAYFSAATGLPLGTPNFPALDPGTPPGRPDPEGSSDRVLRGFIVFWAVNNLGQEIRWNHLYGGGTLVNYRAGSAWEYNAYAHHAVVGANGAQTGTPGVLNMDGTEYSPSFDLLHFDFFAAGSMAFSGPRQVVMDTDLTLQIVSADLRQETEGPITTKAFFEIWNGNEFKFSGVERCITCWDQRRISLYVNFPNHFLLANLLTDKGQARIDGIASAVVCDDLGDLDDPRDDIISQAAALVGLKAKLMIFDGGADVAQAGSELQGSGTQAAVIRYDTGGLPPEQSGNTNSNRREVTSSRPAVRR